MRILFIRAKLGVVKVSSLVVRSRCRTNRKEVLAYPGVVVLLCVCHGFRYKIYKKRFAEKQLE